ncbi:hypothetical protein NE237_019896 [Protea cynaroides]|uniref:Uncharacterized protein n=1 Tax=Protea cynaroides TaxID=273540 RepID=A0A9Q0K1T1_9MAGN|nr:hypothetical protein NE237_019896 [Protea cynaroides]
MGNCQAVDTATLVIQHPNGKVERFYWPVSASEVMRTNPGHHVALVLTLCLPSHSKDKDNQEPHQHLHQKQHQQEVLPINNEVRITRVKVLRPTDTLVLGQAYRLVSSQDVMKGLWARKYAKMKKQNNTQSTDKPPRPRPKEQGSSPSETESTSSHLDKPNQLQVPKQERHRPRTASTKSRLWRPSLQSISEAAS